MGSVRSIGIIGGGQLARMMVQASIGLGIDVALLAEGPDVSAAGVVHDVTVGDYTDESTVVEFAQRCGAITFDHEHVPQAVLRRLASDGVRVLPGPDALVYAQDKAAMRRRLSGMGVPCPAFEIVADAASLAEAGERLGWPLVAKASVGGYDGHGVWVLDEPGQAGVPFEGLRGGAVVVAEEYVDFARELSAVVVRGADGSVVRYAISETVQAGGMCRASITPAPGLGAASARACGELAERIAGELGVVGVLAVELMERRDGSVVVNELAMRPHNTGHWTIGGAWTSQFENHLRAVAGLPLGSTQMTAPWAVMANVLGDEDELDVGGWLSDALRQPRLGVQWYGKGWRPGRKLGHVTAVGEDLGAVVGQALAAMPPGATRDLAAERLWRYADASGMGGARTPGTERLSGGAADATGTGIVRDDVAGRLAGDAVDASGTNNETKDQT